MSKVDVFHITCRFSLIIGSKNKFIVCIKFGLHQRRSVCQCGYMSRGVLRLLQRTKMGEAPKLLERLSRAGGYFPENVTKNID